MSVVRQFYVDTDSVLWLGFGSDVRLRSVGNFRLLSSLSSALRVVVVVVVFVVVVVTFFFCCWGFPFSFLAQVPLCLALLSHGIDFDCLTLSYCLIIVFVF